MRGVNQAFGGLPDSRFGQHGSPPVSIELLGPKNKLNRFLIRQGGQIA
jgi:hypothetical protein